MFKSKETSEFHVRLEGIKLSDNAEKRIEAGIQSLVMSELAGYKPNPDDPDNPNGPFNPPFGHAEAVLSIPREWIGLWLRKLLKEEFKDVAKVGGIKDTLENFKGY